MKIWKYILTMLFMATVTLPASAKDGQCGVKPTVQPKEECKSACGKKAGYPSEVSTGRIDSVRSSKIEAADSVRTDTVSACPKKNCNPVAPPCKASCEEKGCDKKCEKSNPSCPSSPGCTVKRKPECDISCRANDNCAVRCQEISGNPCVRHAKGAPCGTHMYPGDYRSLKE